MSLLHRPLTLLGVLLLAHGIYSAYEHSLLPARGTGSTSQSSSAASRPPLPVDVTIETLLGAVVLLFTTVFTASPLRPIQWAEWAGKIEREGWDPNAVSGQDVSNKGGRGGKGNPYRGLEERRGFWDVRAARKEFADWMKADQQAEVKVVKPAKT